MTTFPAGDPGARPISGKAAQKDLGPSQSPDHAAGSRGLAHGGIGPERGSRRGAGMPAVRHGHAFASPDGPAMAEHVWIEPARVVAERCGISEQAVQMWRRRGIPDDRSQALHRFRGPLTPLQEGVAVVLSKALRLPIDDLLCVLRTFVDPDISRPGLVRCLQRHGVRPLQDRAAAQITRATGRSGSESAPSGDVMLPPTHRGSGIPMTTDDHPFHNLLPLHDVALRRFATKLTGNEHQAEDLVQVTFLKAWANREKFRLDTELRAWLFTILRNTFYSDLRRSRREVADIDGKHAARLYVEPNQEHAIELKALMNAIDMLPELHRQPIVLMGAYGFSQQEAANACGCSLGTIKSRVSRGRSRLHHAFRLYPGQAGAPRKLAL